MSIVTLVGNPKSRSRTLQVGEAVANAVEAETGVDRGPTIDLADVASQLFDPESEIVNALVKVVASSRILVVASPTYKATYTGLLKAFFDRFGSDALSSVLAVPVMTGGAPNHALAIEVGLRPLLVELGASLPTTSLFFVVNDLERLDEIVANWSERNRATWACLKHA